MAGWFKKENGVERSLRQANDLLAKLDYEAAEEKFKSVISEAPEAVDGLLEIYSRKTQNPDELLENFRKMVELEQFVTSENLSAYSKRMKIFSNRLENKAKQLNHVGEVAKASELLQSLTSSHFVRRQTGDVAPQQAPDTPVNNDYVRFMPSQEPAQSPSASESQEQTYQPYSASEPQEQMYQPEPQEQAYQPYSTSEPQEQMYQPEPQEQYSMQEPLYGSQESQYAPVSQEPLYGSQEPVYGQTSDELVYGQSSDESVYGQDSSQESLFETPSEAPIFGPSYRAQSDYGQSSEFSNPQIDDHRISARHNFDMSEASYDNVNLLKSAARELRLCSAFPTDMIEEFKNRLIDTGRFVRTVKFLEEFATDNLQYEGTIVDCIVKSAAGMDAEQRYIGSLSDICHLPYLCQDAAMQLVDMADGKIPPVTGAALTPQEQLGYYLLAYDYFSDRQDYIDKLNTYLDGSKISFADPMWVSAYSTIKNKEAECQETNSERVAVYKSAVNTIYGKLMNVESINDPSYCTLWRNLCQCVLQESYAIPAEKAIALLRGIRSGVTKCCGAQLARELGSQLSPRIAELREQIETDKVNAIKYGGMAASDFEQPEAEAYQPSQEAYQPEQEVYQPESEEFQPVNAPSNNQEYQGGISQQDIDEGIGQFWEMIEEDEQQPAQGPADTLEQPAQDDYAAPAGELLQSDYAAQTEWPTQNDYAAPAEEPAQNDYVSPAEEPTQNDYAAPTEEPTQSQADVFDQPTYNPSEADDMTQGGGDVTVNPSDCTDADDAPKPEDDPFFDDGSYEKFLNSDDTMKAYDDLLVEPDAEGMMQELFKESAAQKAQAEAKEKAEAPQPVKFAQTEVVAQEEITVQPEIVAQEEITVQPEIVAQEETTVQPEAVSQEETTVQPENQYIPEEEYVPENQYAPEEEYIPENQYIPEEEYVPVDDYAQEEITEQPEEEYVPEENYAPEEYTEQVDDYAGQTDDYVYDEPDDSYMIDDSDVFGGGQEMSSSPVEEVVETAPALDDNVVNRYITAIRSGKSEEISNAFYDFETIKVDPTKFAELKSVVGQCIDEYVANAVDPHHFLLVFNPICKKMDDEELNLKVAEYANDEIMSDMDYSEESLEESISYMVTAFNLAPEYEPLRENLRSMISSMSYGNFLEPNEKAEHILSKVRTDVDRRYALFVSQAETEGTINGMEETVSDGLTEEKDALTRIYDIYRSDRNNHRVCEYMVELIRQCIHKYVIKNEPGRKEVERILDRISNNRSATYVECSPKLQNAYDEIYERLSDKAKEALANPSQLNDKGLALAKGLEYLQNLA